MWAKKLSLGLFYLKLKKKTPQTKKTTYANQLNFEHIMTLKCEMVIIPASLFLILDEKQQPYIYVEYPIAYKTRSTDI